MVSLTRNCRLRASILAAALGLLAACEPRTQEPAADPVNTRFQEQWAAANSSAGFRCEGNGSGTYCVCRKDLPSSDPLTCDGFDAHCALLGKTKQCDVVLCECGTLETPSGPTPPPQ